MVEIIRDRGAGQEQGVVVDVQKAFCEEVQKWVGVKYRHRGTTMRGCDCTGMIIGACRKIGYLGKFVLRMYPMDWNLHAGAGDYICEELRKVGDEVSRSSTENGDIVVMKFGKCLAHAGVVVDIKKRLMVHSFLTARKCKYAVLRNSLWSKRWEKTFRLNYGKMAKYS